MTDIVERLRAEVDAAYGKRPAGLLREAADEIMRLRAAYDSRGGEMDSMRMVLAETQKWNEDRVAEIERLRERVASLQASSGYELSIAQLEIERLRAALRQLNSRPTVVSSAGTPSK